MTCQEFYQEFQILYNNIMSNQSPGLDEYEVSVFLTRAQEEFIRGYYNGTLSKSFEETEEIRKYLNSLVKTASCSELTTYSNSAITTKSKFFNLPSDCWFTTFEEVELSGVNYCNGIYSEVVPVLQDDLHRVMRDPFK